jgi:peptidyl-prolyl cis-trans isomerase C
MKEYRMRIGTAIAAVALVAVTSGVAQAQSAEVLADGIVAVVNGDEIRGSDISALYQSLPQQYQQVPMESLFPQMLDNLISRKLVAQAARAARLMDDPEVRRRLTRTEDIVLQDVYLVRKIESEIDEARLRAAFQRMTASWSEEEEIRASHILVATEREAAAVIAALAAGSAFADLARERSIGPSATQGGDLGYIRYAQMVPSFAEAAFALPAGGVSAAPVQTQFGWHVITVVDRRVSRPPSFEDSVEGLREQESQALIRGLVAELRAAAVVEVFAPDGSRIEAPPAASGVQ